MKRKTIPSQMPRDTTWKCLCQTRDSGNIPLGQEVGRKQTSRATSGRLSEQLAMPSLYTPTLCVRISRSSTHPGPVLDLQLAILCVSTLFPCETFSKDFQVPTRHPRREVSPLLLEVACFSRHLRTPRLIRNLRQQHNSSTMCFKCQARSNVPSISSQVNPYATHLVGG